MKIARTFLAVALLLSSAIAANAANIYIESDPADWPTALIGDTGVLNIIVDNTSDPLTFVNGSLGLSLKSSNPGLIRFTDASVGTPEFFGGVLKRWSAGSAVNVQDDSVDELLGVSVSTVGLNDAAPTNDNADGGGPGLFLFAQVGYEVLNVGTTEISLGPITSRPGSFIVQGGQDVSSRVSMSPLSLTIVPEPASMLLATCGLAGLFAVRRRG